MLKENDQKNIIINNIIIIIIILLMRVVCTLVGIETSYRNLLSL